MDLMNLPKEILFIIDKLTTLLSGVLGGLINFRGAQKSTEKQFKHKMREMRRKELADLYTNLLAILDRYPKVTPKEVLVQLERDCNGISVAYGSENFSYVIKVLRNYQTHFAKCEVNEKSYEEKVLLKRKIARIDGTIRELQEIAQMYFDAKKKYRSFCNTERLKFELLASQTTINQLVRFEVFVKNIFISSNEIGSKIGEDLLQAGIDNLCREMRKDLSSE